MLLPLLQALLVTLHVASTSAQKPSAGVKPFRLDLSPTRMNNLIKNTLLPDQEEYPGLGDAFGIDLSYLRSLKETWLTRKEYDWTEEQRKLNEFKHFTVNVEGLYIHFIHERSTVKTKNSTAIPILLLHGWPGSFTEFVPVIRPLTGLGKTVSGKDVTFDVVVASLPGFTFSSAPPANWTVKDTGRVFNTLMTEILGYKTYTVHGTDWGSGVAYSLYESFNATVRGAHFSFLPFAPLSREQLSKDNVTLSSFGEAAYRNLEEWSTTGNGYFVVQTTKPNTIGLALYDSPVGQLSWIAEKFALWSDPTALNTSSFSREILTTTSLYYLTKSFISSAFIYAQNPGGFRSEYVKPATDAPLLYTAALWNVAYWPKEYVEKLGNLVRYTELEKGGHFLGLDNPGGLVEEVRQLGDYYVSR